MKSKKSKISDKAGLPPGTLIHIGNKYDEKSYITCIEYNSEDYQELACPDLSTVNEREFKDSVKWINIDGVQDVELISELGAKFELHPLLLEDIVNTGQRPKSEEYDNCVYLAIKMLGISKNGKIKTEHVSLILGKDFVISIQERRGDIFDGLRERMREGKGILRHKKSDFLFYRLLDTIVDYYYLITEHFTERAEEMEKLALEDPTDGILQEIQRHKRQLLNLKRNMSSVREAVFTFQSEHNVLVSKETIRYFRDVYQHILQVNESLDAYREILSGLMDLYLSGVSNKMNKVMQVLTIIATTFIPLTFIAGIYGMNFENMPELKSEWGYPAVWTLMLTIFIFMLYYFRKKRWL